MFLFENWVRSHFHEKQKSEPQNDDEEALSLCDLVTNEHVDPADSLTESRFSEEHEEDFDFGGAGSNLLENKMCSADELFFRGQILPLRHSVTLPSGYMTRTQELTRSITFSFSRSEPESVARSRSSSARSYNSGTSVSSNTSGSKFTGYKPKIRHQNQFHSHPSPTPQIRTRSSRHYIPKSSSRWSFFLPLGPLKPQEIGLADLKNGRQRSHHSSMKDQDQNENKKHMLFGGCKCSTNVIESTVSSRILMVNATTLKAEEASLGISKETNVGRRKTCSVKSPDI